MHTQLRYILFLILFPFISFAQEKSRVSPLAMATMRYQDAYVKIVYSQPQKRGREIFGKLVPYGKVWRTGANEATEITTTKDIQINNSMLRAGTYSLFTIPEKDQWTIILNSDLGLWGSYNYNPSLDVMRFNVPVQKSEKVSESFTIAFMQRNDLADLLISWDNIQVTIPVKFIH